VIYRSTKSRILNAAKLTLALCVPAWWFISWRLALGWPGMEPFPTAINYTSSWLLYSFALSVPFAFVAMGIAIYLSRPEKWRTCQTLQGLNWLWAIAPLHIAWCVASLLESSYMPGFDGFIYTGKLPATWRAPLAQASSPAVLLLIWLLAALLVPIMMARANAKGIPPADPFAACGKCGYSRSGLTSNTCPECEQRWLTAPNPVTSESNQ
jgi:hypothetical protein